MGLHGLEEKQELSPELLLRDTRTLGMKIVDFFKNPINCAILMITFAISAFLISPMTDLITLIGILIFWYAYTRKSTLPFRMPQRSQALDYNDPEPGGTKPRKARGISYFGNRKLDKD